MKKVSDVFIRGFKYDLLDIPGKKHHNNSTLWVKKDSDIFNDDVEYIPWVDTESCKDCWDINIKQGNYIKYELTNSKIEGFTSITISLNYVHIYTFNTNNLNDAFFDTKIIIDKLKKLPIQLNNFSKDLGRKIFYKKLPCIIIHKSNEGKITVKPDCENNELDKWWNGIIEPWFKDVDYEKLENSKRENTLTIDILDEQIYWHRNDREIKIKDINRKLKKN